MSTRIPRWGLVSAAPHEHLIHLRAGRVLASRQAGSCWRWPGDTVALVDTSVHRLQFSADQVTREKTGVQVAGLAVFRVVQPLLAFKMLNFDEFARVEQILREMFVGATRRLVANLTLDECLTQRKEALATELMAEVAPVVGGRGRAEDSSGQGWGVAIDTIEVQDVRVLSKEVFERLQSPYREGLALRALAARAEVEAEQARIAAEQARAQEQHRRALMALEEERLAAERERTLRTQEHAQEQARRQLQARIALAEAEAQAQQARDDVQAVHTLRLEEQRAASAVRQAELHAQAERLQRTARAELLRLEREAEGHITDARLAEIALTQTLPEVSRAWRGSFERVVLTGGDSTFFTQGLSTALASLEALGLRLPFGASRGGEGPSD